MRPDESPALRRGAFLDRDGTIIRDASYLSHPDEVELLPGAARAVRALNEAGIPVIVVTNQSGLARGYFDLDTYRAVTARLDALLAAEGARIDETMMCPHHPDFGGDCECRKPKPGLFVEGAARHGVDPARSVFIGDRWRDIAPGLALGGRGVFLLHETTVPADRAHAEAAGVPLAHSLEEAVTPLLAEWRREDAA